MPTAKSSGSGKSAASKRNPKLERAGGLTMLVFYGVGSMLGAGIYGLIGQAAGEMGSAVWLAFVVSMVAALLTGFSYASISSRYPRAGGAAYVTQRAYGNSLLSYVVGMAMAASGLASMATQANVIAVNLQETFGMQAVPVSILAIGFLCILAGVLFRGIKESLWFNAVCTAVEMFGLLLVVAVGVSFWGDTNLLEFPEKKSDTGVMLLVMQGAVLTFFSFIGFEDILNLAEEVKAPQRNMPLGILLALAIATVIYLAVAVTAVSVVPWQELAEAPGPLVLVVERAAPWFPIAAFAAITIFAVANTALVNYVTASRLLYGMARQGLIHPALGKVHHSRKTPYIAIGVLLLITIPLALVGDIGELAAATVLLLLMVFAVVNGALVVLKRRKGEKPGHLEVPMAVPVLGAIVCVGLIGVRLAEGNWIAPAIGGGLLLAILASYILTPGGKSLKKFAGVKK